MRLHSTPQSIGKGEITALAVAECAVSVAIYLLIGLYSGSLLHLKIAIACGPLFLLRTKYSYTLGLGVWNKFWDATDQIKSPMLGLLSIPLVTIAGLAIRFSATAVGLLRHPLVTLKNIPRNWTRQALATDLFAAPEIVPGEGSSKGRAITINELLPLFLGIREEFRENPIEAFIFLIGRTMLVILGYIPALLFRISFKATFLGYAPLIWAAHSTINKSWPPRQRLQTFTLGKFEETRRWLSRLIIVLFVSKLALAKGVLERTFIEETLGSKSLATYVVDSWPPWHISLIGDAILTFFLFYYADHALRGIEGGRTNGDWEASVVATLSLVRASLAILAALYIFSQSFAAAIQALSGCCGLALLGS